MSESERHEMIGKATAAYSEAKTTLALLRRQFTETGETLKNIGEALIDGSERALYLVSNNPMKLVDAEKLRQALEEFKAAEETLQARKKTLSSFGITVD